MRQTLAPRSVWLALVAALVLGAGAHAAPRPLTSVAEIKNPELERLVQALRPFDDRFVRQPPLELPLHDAIELFHQLWQLGRRGVRLAGADRALAADFRVIERQSHTVVRAGMQAAPGFRVDVRTRQPIVTIEEERRTGALVATMVARGDLVVAAIGRILSRFPLWGDDAAWGYRPPPPWLKLLAPSPAR